ncbi:MAG TPA: glycosyltransferase family 39 protein [Thermoanaerobaculia bacterium]|nr:glycosyltransferase family 39 protein [Thermoanaerobaculia bacterium]
MTRSPRPAGPPRAAPWLALAGGGALVVAGRFLAVQDLAPAAIAALAAGLLAWIAAVWIDPPAPDLLGDLDPREGAPRWTLLALAVAAAAACWWRMPAEEFRLDGVAAWLIAIASWFAAWRPRARSRPRAPMSWPVRLALAAILAVAAWFLFHDLARVPGNPVSDHAEEMQDLDELLRGSTRVYFLKNLGIPPFYFYWTAAFLKLTGLPLRFLSVKAATATFGLLLAPALYLCGAELAGPGLGLAAAAFAAWGKWPVALAREGQEYVFAIPTTAFALWAILRWLRRGDRGSLLWAGLALGAGMATYATFRVVPLLIPLAVVAALLDRRRRGLRWRAVADGALAAAMGLVVFLPVLKFALLGGNRDFFWSRVLTRATGVERPIEGNPLGIFVRNLGNMAAAFHWQGSSTWTLLLRYDPLLDVVSGALLLAGIVLAFRLALSGAWRWTLLLLLLVVLTLPSTLVLAYPEENPSVNRASAAIPAVFLLVGLAAAYLGAGFRREGPGLRAAGFAALLAGALVSARENAEAYFRRLGTSYDALIEHAVEIAAVLSRYRDEGIPLSQQYLLSTRFWVDARNVAFQLGDPGWWEAHNVPPHETPEGLTARPLAFVYRSNDVERQEALRRLYPEGVARIFPQSNADRSFVVYLVR